MFENELKDSCVYNEARVGKRIDNEIKEIFTDELEKFVGYFVYEFELQGVKITPNDLSDMESGNLFTVSFEDNNETLNVRYDMEISDDSGDISILRIKCETFKCKLLEYQNGNYDYNEETELYEPTIENTEYSYFENAKTSLINYIKEIT